jgi:acyl-CoA thioester hydrolase
MVDSLEIELRVRYQETDGMGFLHHANYLTYFEVGRTELLRAAGQDYRSIEEAGTLMVVVRMECRYHRPARYDDVLRLLTTCTRITAAKIEHAYELWREATLLATASSTLACVNREGVVQRVPEWLRRAGARRNAD